MVDRHGQKRDLVLLTGLDVLNRQGWGRHKDRICRVNLKKFQVCDRKVNNVLDRTQPKLAGNITLVAGNGPVADA